MGRPRRAKNRGRVERDEELLRRCPLIRRCDAGQANFSGLVELLLALISVIITRPHQPLHLVRPEWRFLSTPRSSQIAL
jgi:hypothetical protein